MYVEYAIQLYELQSILIKYLPTPYDSPAWVLVNIVSLFSFFL